jgi:hypothetical protein
MHDVFHSSQLKRFIENDPSLFPSHEHSHPGPIVTPEGLEEYLIDKIVDSRRQGKQLQYLVCWAGYGPAHDCWLAAKELDECEALDVWLGQEGHGLGVW